MIDLLAHRQRVVVCLALAAAVFLTPGPQADEMAKSSWWIPKIREKEVAPTAASTADEMPELIAGSKASPSAKEARAVAAAQEAAAPTIPSPSLQKISQRLRQGPIGQEKNAAVYLDLIDAGKASAAQVNDFAAYLGKRGAPKIALAYQQYALTLNRTEPLLWLNLGTLHSTLGNLSAAETAFETAIDLNPNNALAHYNLGSIFDLQDHYDDAIEEYRKALVLDPELGDARKNPQVVNNPHILAVKLAIYRNESGAFGLPLIQIQQQPKASVPAPEKPADKN